MYYLAYCSETNQLVYLDEVPPTGLNDKYVVEYHEETLPRLDQYTWNPSSLGFVLKPNISFTRFEFLNRFTMAERIAIRSAAETDSIVFDINEQFNQAEEITLGNDQLVQGLGYLTMVGILTPERAEQILQK